MSAGYMKSKKVATKNHSEENKNWDNNGKTPTGEVTG